MLYFIFFFKQKTAYEMRISDWSSDVCSSDLAELKAIQEFAKTQGVEAVACEHWGKGSEGTEELAHKVVALADGGTANFKPLYDEKLPLFDKIDTICKQIYGASGAVADKKVRDPPHPSKSYGYGQCPVCRAQTNDSVRKLTTAR